ncbi:menaquinone biosynthetic enzyme MqnA/MqnD family protein [Paenibacillus sp. NPDC058071]|uniref:menaquinone biosynthetic enzyme MqnA/MqnD family protein n=1 Tax=Paenibacillus sp. NPDC058071 TaxID=3346326 RepID=UPI0036DB81A7
MTSKTRNNGKERLNVGRIDYANAWPLFHYLEPDEEAGIEIVYRVPAVLNRMLQEGDIQVSGISSFAYGLNDSQYLLLPHLSVGSEGNVNSIILFLKEPIDRKPPQKIKVTTTSATSVNLLKIIMANYYGLDPVYEAAEPDLDSMLEDADGALLIGDQAIHASWSKQGLHAIDLGGLWNSWTGLAMTYAVVAVRRDAVEKSREAVEAVYRSMIASKRKSVSHLGPLIDKACTELGGTAAYWQMYFTSLRYDFDEKQQAGLALYFRYAKELGLLEHEVELRFYEHQSAE